MASKDLPEHRRPWITEKALLISVASLACILAVILYLYVPSGSGGKEGDRGAKAWALLHEVLPNLVMALLAFLLLSWLLYTSRLRAQRNLVDDIALRVVELAETDHGVTQSRADWSDFDWSALLSSSKEVVGVARFLDVWAGQLQAELKAFFNRGGRLKVFMTDPDAELAVRIAADQQDTSRVTGEAVIATDSVTHSKERLQAGKARLETAFKNRDSRGPAKKAQLKLFYTQESINYGVILFDGRQALFSAYAHWASHEQQMPYLLFDLAAAKEFGAWLRHELALFEEKSIPVDAPTESVGVA
jgi:hypothetical protein